MVNLYNGTLLTDKNYGLELMCQHWFISNNKSATLMQDVSIRGNIMGTGETNEGRAVFSLQRLLKCSRQEQTRKGHGQLGNWNRESGR